MVSQMFFASVNYYYCISNYCCMNRTIPTTFFGFKMSLRFLMVLLISVTSLIASAQNKKAPQKKQNANAPQQSFREIISSNSPDSIKVSNDHYQVSAATTSYPVLYAVQSRDRLVQSVSYLSGHKLESAPVSLLSNAFAGQLSGLYSQQTNGAPRFDNPNLSLRGRNPLIVIDGVPRYNLVNLNTGQTLYDVLSINPEQVASVTLLKDALSTAMLGNRGMDGVLMITTRNKGEEKSPTFSITAQTGFQQPVKMRKTLSSYEYAKLYNEALVNVGRAPLYSQAQLDAYQSGSDPYLYPDVDWQKTVFKSNAPISRYNLSSGGNYTNVKYFLSLDYTAQGGLLRENPANQQPSNVDYKRYIFRSNVELNIDRNLTASLNVLGNIQDYIQPGVGYASIFSSLVNTPANATSVYNFTGSYGGTNQYQKNPYAQSVATGYLKNNLQAASVDVGLKRNMNDVVKGSWLKALLSYSPSYEQEIRRVKDYNAYNYPVTGDTTRYNRVNTIADQTNTQSVLERLQQTYIELSAGINRDWQKNSFTGLILANYDNQQSDNTLNQIYQGLSTRLSYSFDNRYNVEVAGAYNRNNQFEKGKQFGFYPAAGVSWNIHNEKFFMHNTLFNQLKIRGSYGKVGNADPGYYLYRQTYRGGTAYYFGNGATSNASVFQGTLAYSRVAEKATKLNVGVDVAFSKQRGWLNLDYYNNRQYDLLQVRGDNTALLGQVYPQENIGVNKYFGFELNAGWADKAGTFNYSVSGNLSTVNSRIIFNDEPEQAYPWMARSGKPVNQIRGYIAEGFFSPSNLNAATLEGYIPVAGDVKYKDLNGDNIINVYDQTIIGNDKPLMFYGGNISLMFKGFDLNVLLQGVLNRDIVTNGSYNLPFQNGGRGQAYESNLNRYTPETAATATMPRVTIGTNINNYVTSSLYVQNGNYMRLKNLEVGYSFSNKFLSAARIRSIRLFVNGYNLLTTSKYNEADPEVYTAVYPLQRIINGGLSVKL